MKLRASILAACLVLSATHVTAQEQGTVELGGFAQATGFDGQTTLSDATAWGMGGFGGLFLARNLALELGVARSWTEDATPAGTDGTWTPFRGRLVYAIPAAEQIYPLVGLGFVRNGYDGFFDEGDTGISGLVGLKGYVTERLALRTDLSLDHIWSPFNDGVTVGAGVVEDHTNWTWTVGLSVDLGRGRSKDTDGDGVRDREDRCSATPMGVGVGTLGCRLDADGDGVFDEEDLCSGTRGVRVDAQGCRVDTDRDGVFDEEDECNSTPDGVVVDGRGCRVDTDGDGVFDEEDQCSGTPTGVGVDGSGCRVDSDADGVYDEDDRCAETARGTDVDSSGCPVLFDDEGASVVLEGVTFETSSPELTEGARAILDRVAVSLVGNPDIRVRVGGHTDSTGPRAFNVNLSQARAESVAAYLASKGVATDRMEARGYGPGQPIATNDTPEGRAVNRRVELERIN